MGNRYIRQEILEEIGKEGQDKIQKGSVAVIGVGALGTCTCELLVRAGIGKLLLVDNDKIDLTNLQRQLLFDEDDVGKKKVVVAKEKLSKINSEVEINIVNEFLDENNIDLLDDYDLVLDCTDNMKARHVINDYCENKKKKWIYSAAIGVTGNILVVDDYMKFRSIFKSGEAFDNCENIGVINTIIPMISSIQVTETIKILTNQEYTKELIRINNWENDYQTIKL